MKASGLPYPPKLMQVLSFLCTSKCHHYPLPVGSLNLYHELLKAGNAREILKKKKASVGLCPPFLSASTQPQIPQDAKLQSVLTVHGPAPFRLPDLCSKAQQNFWAPGVCARLWVCCQFLSCVFITKTLTDNYL